MDVCYVFNNPFKNRGGKNKFTFSATVALIQSCNSQSSSVLLSISVFVARAVLPVDGRTESATADGAEGGCWVSCWSWVNKCADNSVLFKLHFGVWQKVNI